MLWIKAFHIISMVCWFAALFYLPRLFVYHSQSDDEISNARFKIMERKLYRGISTPAMIFTLVLGFGLLSFNLEGYLAGAWFHAKLFLVTLLVGYHFYSGHLLKQFRDDTNTHSHIFYRWFNEFPVLLLISIIILVVVKPF